MPKFVLDCRWECHATITVDAPDLEAAIEHANQNPCLPNLGELVDDSFRVNRAGLERPGDTAIFLNMDEAPYANAIAVPRRQGDNVMLIFPEWNRHHDAPGYVRIYSRQDGWGWMNYDTAVSIRRPITVAAKRDDQDVVMLVEHLQRRGFQPKLQTRFIRKPEPQPEPNQLIF